MLTCSLLNATKSTHAPHNLHKQQLYINWEDNKNSSSVTTNLSSFVCISTACDDSLCYFYLGSLPLLLINVLCEWLLKKKKKVFVFVLFFLRGILATNWSICCTGYSRRRHCSGFSFSFVAQTRGSVSTVGGLWHFPPQEHMEQSCTAATPQIPAQTPTAEPKIIKWVSFPFILGVRKHLWTPR